MNEGKLSIIWGGQFGSEGKGQIASFIQEEDFHHLAVRVGGPNAGHTFYLPGPDGSRTKVVVQSIPVATYYGAHGIIGPAGYIIMDLLIEELKRGLEVTGKPLQLTIDPMAVIINMGHMSRENELTGRIGSTGEGVGAATSDKIMRVPNLVVGKWMSLFESFQDQEWFKQVKIMPTSQIVNSSLRDGLDVMIEGTQGYGLSLHTGGYYPFCTSRECTPQALIAETGIGAHHARYVESVMVLRTFPIRVGGNSGPLPNEIDWETLSKETGNYIKPEITTVTKKQRRIARFDHELVSRAIDQCGPTSLAINFLDYAFPELAGVDRVDNFPSQVNDKLWKMEKSLGVDIKYVSWAAGKTGRWHS